MVIGFSQMPMILVIEILAFDEHSQQHRLSSPKGTGSESPT